MRQKINLMMTCTGGDLAPEYLKAFKASTRFDINIIGVDASEQAIGRYFSDFFETVPFGSSPNYVDRVVEIVKKYGVEIIIIGSDAEAIALSANRDIFSQLGCQIASPESSILKTLDNKILTYQLLQSNDIAHAKWHPAFNKEDMESAVDDIYGQFGECVVKPAVSAGGRNVFVIRSDINEEQSFHGGRETHLPLKLFKENYRNKLDSFLPLIIMQRLYEPTYDVDVLSWKGTPVQVIPRLRHNPAGIPFTGNTIKPDGQLIELGEKVIKAFNLSWLLDMDVMSTKDGRPVVLEVNPRMSGSCPAGIAAGVPLFDNIIALSRGEGVARVTLDKEVVILSLRSILRVDK